MYVIYYDSLKKCLLPLTEAIKESFPNVYIQRRGLTDKRYINEPRAVVIGHGLGGIKAMDMALSCGLLITINPHKIINSASYKKPISGPQLNFLSHKGFLKGEAVEGAFNIELFNEGYFSVCESRTLLEFAIANMHDI